MQSPIFIHLRVSVRRELFLVGRVIIIHSGKMLAKPKISGVPQKKVQMKFKLSRFAEKLIFANKCLSPLKFERS